MTSVPEVMKEYSYTFTYTYTIHRWKYNTANVFFFVLDNKVYKHTLRIFNNYCFATATTVSLTHLNIKFYATCVSSSKFSQELNQLFKLAADPITSTQLRARETRIQSSDYLFIYYINLLIVSQNPYTGVRQMNVETAK